MSLEDGLRLVSLCIGQLKNRFLINMKRFIVKVVDKDGVRTIPFASYAVVEDEKGAANINYSGTGLSGKDAGKGKDKEEPKKGNLVSASTDV